MIAALCLLFLGDCWSFCVGDRCSTVAGHSILPPWACFITWHTRTRTHSSRWTSLWMQQISYSPYRSLEWRWTGRAGWPRKPSHSQTHVRSTESKDTPSAAGGDHVHVTVTYEWPWWTRRQIKSKAFSQLILIWHKAKRMPAHWATCALVHETT